MDKVVWFLEMSVSGQYRWWGADSSSQPWTIDPNKAVHFSDKASAERAALVLGGSWFPTEHMFCAPATQDISNKGEKNE